MLASFIIPCYRSEGTLRSVVEGLVDSMAKEPLYEYEIILVNDCSPDGTEAVIRGLCEENAHIVGISLAKNFGQHAALMAGFRHAGGDVVVCLDDDGQTPAEEAMKLIVALEDGADVAYARYAERHHSGLRRLGSRFNGWMMRIMLGKPKDLYLSSYFAARRFVADEIKRYEGPYPYLMGLVLRATRNIVNVDVSHNSRLGGVSGYTFGRLIALWLNGFTAFSVKPLRIATFVGTVSALSGFVYALYTIYKRLFIQPDGLWDGFAALISAVLVLGGLILMMLGLLGEYLGRLYIMESKSPQYVIREKYGHPRELSWEDSES